MREGEVKYSVGGGGRREIDLTPALPTAEAVPLTNAGVTECHKVSQRILKLLSPLSLTILPFKMNKVHENGCMLEK